MGIVFALHPFEIGLEKEDYRKSGHLDILTIILISIIDWKSKFWVCGTDFLPAPSITPSAALQLPNKCAPDFGRFGSAEPAWGK